jgi:hypothetical protein
MRGIPAWWWLLLALYLVLGSAPLLILELGIRVH